MEITSFFIYVGLNDKETGTKLFDSEKYLSVLRTVCRNYRVAFTVEIVHGGYFHEDGRYTEEETLVVGFVQISEEIVAEIAKDLCTFFNQESVMVASSPATIYYINEKLDDGEADKR